MNKLAISLVLLLFATATGLFFCSPPRETSPCTCNAHNVASTIEDNALQSGPTNSVPWEEDATFKTAQANIGALRQLAAYRTVLKDPLPGEEENVHLAASMIAGSVVKSGKVFSQNAKAGPYTHRRGFQRGPTYIGSTLSTTVGGGVCKIASTLYNVTVLSDMKVVERHAHGMPVPYVPYGQDATVSYGVKDFKFQNTSDSPLLIWAQGIGNTLYMAFYASTPPPRVEWNHQFLQIYKARIFIKKNPKLPPGTEKVVLEGMDGAKVRSWVQVETPNGNSLTKQMGISYYKPMHTIVEQNK